MSSIQDIDIVSLQIVANTPEMLSNRVETFKSRHSAEKISNHGKKTHAGLRLKEQLIKKLMLEAGSWEVLSAIVDVLSTYFKKGGLRVVFLWGCPL